MAGDTARAALSIQGGQTLLVNLTRMTDGARTAWCLGAELFCDLRDSGAEISGRRWLFLVALARQIWKKAGQRSFPLFS